MSDPHTPDPWVFEHYGFVDQPAAPVAPSAKAERSGAGRHRWRGGLVATLLTLGLVGGTGTAAIAAATSGPATGDPGVQTGPAQPGPQEPGHDHHGERDARGRP